tara:strand:- start:90 stop:1025 length:936 start_codon:yes stop_codon:yes gene_type:complete
MVFFSIAYILLQYENRNELIIFWNFGIKKIYFVNFFIKFSIIMVVIHLILNTFLVPYSQDKARSFIRSSDLDFFESILKPKRFIDIVKNLTIYFDEKTIDNKLKNIFLKDESKNDGFKVTIAKMGKFVSRGGKKILILYDGKTLNNRNGTLSEFAFTQTDFNIAKFSSKTISVVKTQENSTYELIKCIYALKEIKRIKENYDKIFIFSNCRIQNIKNIYKELYKRLIIPFYNISLIMIATLLILKSKNDKSYNIEKFKIFTLGFLLIIFLEMSLNLITSSLKENIFIFFLPFIFSLIGYLYYIKKLHIKKS